MTKVKPSLPTWSTGYDIAEDQLIPLTVHSMYYVVPIAKLIQPLSDKYEGIKRD